ncbi:MAG: sugar phosphate isomerase/epimerase family protein [Fibrobacterota bacterium]
MEITFVDQPFNDAQYVEGMNAIGKIGYKRVEVKDRRFATYGADNVGKTLKEAGLGIIQINTYFDVVHGPEAVEKSLGLNKEMIALAVRFNVPFIRVFTGPLGEPGIGTDKATPQIWKEATDGLRQICKEGAKHKIAYAVETHHGTLAETTPSILKLIELINCPNFHVNLQIPLKGKEDVYETTRLLAPYVRHTHLNNMDATGHNTYLSEGVYDIRKEIEILRKAGFDGALSVEHAYHHQPVVDVAKREFEFLSKIVKDLG